MIKKTISREGTEMCRKVICFIVSALTLVAVFGMTAASVSAGSPSKQVKIDRAMQAAPPSISMHATIMDVDGTVLRQGTNGWHCMPASGPGSTHPMCNDKVWMSALEALSKKADFKTDRVGISYMLAGDDLVNNADPFDTRRDPGEVWVQEGPHLMILVPDPQMLDGISDDPDNGGPYVMWKGTPYAHIMVPVAPRQKQK
jgi:hypothetical protein